MVVVVSVVVVVGRRWWCGGQIGIGDDDGAVVVVVVLHCGKSLNRSLMMVLTCFSPFPYFIFFILEIHTWYL